MNISPMTSATPVKNNNNPHFGKFVVIGSNAKRVATIEKIFKQHFDTQSANTATEGLAFWAELRKIIDCTVTLGKRGNADLTFSYHGKSKFYRDIVERINNAKLQFNTNCNRERLVANFQNAAQQGDEVIMSRNTYWGYTKTHDIIEGIKNKLHQKHCIGFSN